MRRLTGRRGSQRGATAVTMALLMLVLMAGGALSVDLGMAYAEQQQLRNGADAAALAIAESCARGACVDSADSYVKANKLDGKASGTVEGPIGPSTVTVSAQATRTNYFAGILGFPTTDLTARATAQWGWPSAGATLPLTFSWCAFYEATGGWDDQGKPLVAGQTTVHLIEKSCTPPAHNEVPGGFGWLTGVKCVSMVVSGQWVLSDPGNDGSTSCKDFDWTTIQNKTVLVPIFDAVSGTGSNAQYKIKGLAAFTITGYCFSSSAKWNVTKCPADKQVKGTFANYVDLTGNYTIDVNATHFGVPTIKLTS